ncbi:MAG: hydantoinase/oxoprolinase family protein [Spirochaetes bacterium]|nr:hydantoinase/oxoprolinase family protein [Spirochaetota bacterium]
MIAGIDIGGTHTDAVLVDNGRIVAKSKIPTLHEDLVKTVQRSLTNLTEKKKAGGVTRITLSTTLATNALVEGALETAGVLVCSGPGIDPLKYSIGPAFHLVGGSVDHRGRETEPVDTRELDRAASECREKGVRVFACVAKFSPRNPAHELLLSRRLAPHADFITEGHRLSGMPGFGRRIATAYYNAAVWRLFNRFADAASSTAAALGIGPDIHILKADGGTMPLSESRILPVLSILSGPAASIMGIQALFPVNRDAVCIDIGGTTSDIFFLADGVPLFERGGIALDGRNTLVPSLFSKSIGVGGDSHVRMESGRVTVGPRRLGPAMATGDKAPTLTDALNVSGRAAYGDVSRSQGGIGLLAKQHGADPGRLADEAVSFAANAVAREVERLVAAINERPVYTVRELLHERRLVPERLLLMGGPADCLAKPLGAALGIEAGIPEHFDVANAIGAALTKPTRCIELFADTAIGIMSVPALGVRKAVPAGYTESDAERDAARLLLDRLKTQGVGLGGVEVETTYKSTFSMVEGFSTVGRNIRIRCQVKPGLLYDLVENKKE